MTRHRARRREAVAGEPIAPGRSGLGPLETRVLEHLWDRDRAVTVRDVQLAFAGLAYTTLMTTLDRLYRKGLLLRRRLGRAFTYQPRCSRDELLSEVVSGHVTDLLGARGASTMILSTLVRAVGRSDAALLDELDVLVQAERRRLKLEDT
ncbi:MAG TPA: BlaI/MecI/CopY family transcriptional regulator [Steroidobacteraceae bacterium]|nr:BlaI/MecI/CopY family transcriptional regulator [Steroidobacteraceae bacterium]